jgi:hypothetical protein
MESLRLKWPFPVLAGSVDETMDRTPRETMTTIICIFEIIFSNLPIFEAKNSSNCFSLQISNAITTVFHRFFLGKISFSLPFD